MPRVNIELDGQVVEQVSCFTYLGQTKTEDGKCDEEIKRRIGQARSAFNSMRDVLCCRRLPLSSCLRLFKCYVWSTLLYGVESWTVSKTSKKRLNAFEMWSLRRMMRVSWMRRLSNENVLKLAGVKRELFRVVQNRKLCYFDHMMRNENIQRNLIEGMVQGKRGRETPRIQWCHNVIDLTGMGFAVCNRAAQNRLRWRCIAFNPRTGDGT